MAITPEQVDALTGSDEERHAVELEFYVSVLEEMIDSAFRSGGIIDSEDGGRRVFSTQLSLTTLDAEWLRRLSADSLEALTTALRSRYVEAGWSDLELRPVNLEVRLIKS